MRTSSARIVRCSRVLVACGFAALSLMHVPRVDAAARTPTAGGTQLWAAREAGPHGAYDTSAGFAVSPDGSPVYVAATSNGAFVIDAHDAATGASIWRVRTAGPHGKQIFADALAMSPDGTRLFVTGDVEQTIDTRSAQTVAYDSADGTALWTALLSPGTHSLAIPRRIAVSSDGSRVFVAGSRTGIHGINDFWDFFTVGYDAGTGAESWTSTYSGEANGGDTAEGLGISPDGTRVFVTGTSVGSGTDRDFATVAYAAGDGSQRWVSRYDEGADDWTASIALSPDGSRLYVAGFGRPSFSLTHRFLIVAYGAATGARKWVGRHDDGGDGAVTALALSPDGSRAFVTGGGSNDFTTAGFDTSIGAKLWATPYDGGHGLDIAYAIAVSPVGGHVYVTGTSDEGRVACFEDIESYADATVGYDAATGGQVWASRYGGLKKDPDQATGAAVSPDGSAVYVTGASDFGCVSSDVATIAYQA